MYCPDNQGIVTTITKFIAENSGNVLYLDQHVDKENQQFFMRVEWDLKGFNIPQDKIGDYFDTLIAKKYNMKWSIYFSDVRPRMAIFVSMMSHCGDDMLARYSAGEWNVEIPLIVSNHNNMEHVAKQFGIPYHVFPVNSKNKVEQEAMEVELLKQHRVNFIVLARYMQILSENFIAEYPNKIINIHHSFLPAFAGAKPYHASFERGVKIIGATSHYVTADLDAGPIIEQDVVRVTHKDSVEGLVHKGRDLEKIVLSRAVFAHLQRKVLVYNNKTIIFS
jgi:formyltetrahydrofolate deformylase